MERYKVEPYVLCADIYAVPPHTGRGGWTWYTGAAGWMYRLVVETLLGLRLEAHHLSIAPCMPETWDAYRIDYRYRSAVYHIKVRRVAAGAALHVTLDGQVIAETAAAPQGRPQGVIPLHDDGREHDVEVVLG
jgi:cellobiose phosphorylase